MSLVTFPLTCLPALVTVTLHRAGGAAGSRAGFTVLAAGMAGPAPRWPRPGITPGWRGRYLVPSADLADAVSRLRRAMRRAARAADRQSGLSVAQLEMLSCLAENPGSRPGQLARLLRLAPSSVATLTQSLRQSGLVTRTGGAGDRRTASLDLTPAGETAVLRWKTLNERLLSEAQAALPPERRSALNGALPALADLAGAVDALAELAGGTGPLAGPGAALPGLAGQGDEPPASRTAS